uniref:protein phosphatase 1 regulatory subunit 14A-like n=1 Tax=Pristiophorus japonicus TaxID=55135 RepID=UPI00398F8703
MAAQRAGRKCPGPGPPVGRRQARVTVRYDRGELRRRLELESWTEERLRGLYTGQEDQMPEEVNIDDLLDLQTDEERGSKLQSLFASCSQNTDEFISELLTKLQGLHKVLVPKPGSVEPVRQ